MPRNLIPEDRWETTFEVPLPGEPRRIGPLAELFQRLLNRTERLKERIAAILGTDWEAAPPDTLAGLAARVDALEGGAGAPGAAFYDLALFYLGAPPSGGLLAAIVIPRALSLQGGLVRVRVGPAANWSALIYADSAIIGTIFVPSGGTSGTVMLYSTPTSLDAETLLRIVGPSTADSSIRDISISLQGVA